MVLGVCSSAVNDRRARDCWSCGRSPARQRVDRESRHVGTRLSAAATLPVPAMQGGAGPATAAVGIPRPRCPGCLRRLAGHRQSGRSPPTLPAGESGAGTVCLCAGPGGPWPTVRRAAWALGTAARHGGERRSRVRARAEQLVSECAHGADEQHGQWNCSLTGHPPAEAASAQARAAATRAAGRGSSGRSGLTPSRRAISGTIISCQCSCFFSWSIRSSRAVTTPRDALPGGGGGRSMNHPAWSRPPRGAAHRPATPNFLPPQRHGSGHHRTKIRSTETIWSRARLSHLIRACSVTFKTDQIY